MGAGLAGLSAAERLREVGFHGELVIVGEEPHRPYNRTPLSKGLLTGSRRVEDLALRTFTKLDAQWRLGTAAAGLDLTQRAVTLDDGTQLEFDGLVIASGVTANGLPGAPMHSPHVWPLRTLEDARQLDRGMGRADRIAIIGGGFIGTELASTARERGLAATIVDRSSTLLHRSMGRAIGSVVGDLHRRAGVRLHLGVSVLGWEETRRGVTLHLEDDETVHAQLAVVGVGTKPSTAWLEGSGVATGDGVLCGATTHVLDPRGRPIVGIVAAGDVARWPNLRFDEVPRRVEHWINAIEMGRAAADALVAGRSRATPFTPTPRFWSHQHGVRIQSSGIPSLGTKMTVLEGSVDRGRFLAGFSRDVPGSGQQLVGTVALDAPRAAISFHESVGQVVHRKAVS